MDPNVYMQIHCSLFGILFRGYLSKSLFRWVSVLVRFFKIYFRIHQTYTSQFFFLAPKNALFSVISAQHAQAGGTKTPLSMQSVNETFVCMMKLIYVCILVNWVNFRLGVFSLVTVLVILVLRDHPSGYEVLGWGRPFRHLKDRKVFNDILQWIIADS